MKYSYTISKKVASTLLLDGGGALFLSSHCGVSQRKPREGVKSALDC